MKYFAYGSNLDLAQMAQRCPAVQLVGMARLVDHRLCFPRRSPVRGCAVASIEPHERGIVWGAIYELGHEDLARLDAREGYDQGNPLTANCYDRVEVLVQPVSGDVVRAQTYVAIPEQDPGVPSPRYMKHIIDGALAHSFPEEYVQMLRSIEVIAKL